MSCDNHFGCMEGKRKGYSGLVGKPGKKLLKKQKQMGEKYENGTDMSHERS